MPKKKIALSPVECRDLLAALRWGIPQLRDRQPNGDLTIAGPPSATWKGRMRARRVATVANEIAGKKVWPVCDLSLLEVELLDQIWWDTGGLFHDARDHYIDDFPGPQRGKVRKLLDNGYLKSSRTGLKITNKGEGALCGL